MPQAKRKLFSKSERVFIWKQTLGTPTGVKVEIAGFEFDLTMLTTGQAMQILDIMESIPELQGAGDGTAQIDMNRAISLVATRGREVLDLGRSVLLRSAEASDLIDKKDDGLEVFDEWFKGISVVEVFTKLVGPVIQANGLGSLLKNAAARAPMAVPAAEPTETD